jgi:hypothetical protein
LSIRCIQFFDWRRNPRSFRVIPVCLSFALDSHFPPNMKPIISFVIQKNDTVHKVNLSCDSETKKRMFNIETSGIGHGHNQPLSLNHLYRPVLDNLPQKKISFFGLILLSFRKKKQLCRRNFFNSSPFSSKKLNLKTQFLYNNTSRSG